MTKRIFFILLAVQTVALSACGGGGGGGAAQPKAVISFSLLSTQSLPFRINGVLMTATLPANLTVSTGANKEIVAGLNVGSAVAGMLIFGSYSSPLVKISVLDSTPAQTGFGPGEMTRLTCQLAVGTTITENDRLAIENSLTFMASGFDPNAATNPSSLNGFLRPRIAVTLLD